MNYFIGEFLGSKIMIVANNGYYFSPLSEILRDPLWGPQDRTLCPVWPCVSTIVQIIIVVKTVIVFRPFCDPGRPPMGSRGPSRLGFSNELFHWGIPRFENNDRF